MKSSPPSLLVPFGLITLGVAIGAAGIYVGDTDDAPGAALAGIMMMIGLVTFGAREVWRRRSSSRAIAPLPKTPDA